MYSFKEEESWARVMLLFLECADVSFKRRFISHCANDGSASASRGVADGFS